jgi:hypothetical protein
MQSPENLRTQHPFERREDRYPRPKREINHRLGVSIVKWPNLRLYRCHLSTLTETAPSHPTYSPHYFSHRGHSYTSQSLGIGLQLSRSLGTQPMGYIVIFGERPSYTFEVGGGKFGGS